MLARWFDRSGIGQYLAPDENAANEAPSEEGQLDLWQLLAPDPKFAPPQAPPPGAFIGQPQVLCHHCHQWTAVTLMSPPTQHQQHQHQHWNHNKDHPTTPSTPSLPPPGARGFETPFLTPQSHAASSGRHYPSSQFTGDNVERLVLSAAKETAVTMTSPAPKQKQADKIFRLCANQKPLDAKLAKRLRTMITKKPSLLRARATFLGQLVPDGLTPLMAAAYAGQLQAAEIVWAVAAEQNTAVASSLLMDRDYQGRCALHFAAEQGHVEMVNFLLPKYRLGTTDGESNSNSNININNNNHNKISTGGLMQSPPPVDLLGRTPLGLAITSPVPTARKKRSELEKSLFSPGDLSVFGRASNPADRTAYDPSLQLMYGIADMPGMRVTMEDAVCTSRFELAGQAYWLLGVCDGHGDQGTVSDFVATHVPGVLQTHMRSAIAATAVANGEGMDWSTIWKTTCLEVDAQLNEAALMGGSTAVFCLVGPDVLVVANVGDSRAILIQSSLTTTTTTTTATTTTGLEDQVAQLAISESTAECEGYPTTIDADAPQPATLNLDTDAPTSAAIRKDNNKLKGPVAIALSDDHKPELPEETARIEAAGMKVVPITFEEDGKEVTIHKVAKSDNDMLAVSRAFGDFEYKANPNLPAEEQAVTAVADIRVHPRSPTIDLYLILACDGIWDVCDNDFVKDFILHQVQVRKEISDTVLPDVGDSLLRESLNRGSRDNMTTIIVALSGEAEGIANPTLKGKTLDFASPRK